MGSYHHHHHPGGNSSFTSFNLLLFFCFMYNFSFFIDKFIGLTLASKNYVGSI